MRTRVARTMHGHCFLQGLVSLLLCVSTVAQESPQLRVVDGGHRCAGRVEILHHGSWATICDDTWGMSDTHVVCRQLGCGVALYLVRNAFFGSGPTSIWLKSPGCTSKETHVWQCPSWSWGQHNCSKTPDVGVICSGFVRLSGGHGLCSGRVEVNPGGAWTPVSAVNFTLPAAQVICAELGCGKTVSVLGNRNASEHVWAEEFWCEGQEPGLWLCPRAPCPGGSCQHGGAVEVVCGESPQLRLVDGGHRCEGRVEILHQGSWGTICDDSWDKSDGQVVCRQLDCGEALDVTYSSHFGPGLGPIWLNDMRCTGEETHVWKCPSLGWGRTYCTHEEDAGVICSGFVRLAAGLGPCSGRVEVNPGGAWTPVSAANFTLPTAQVICAELGCGKAVSVREDLSFRVNAGQVWAEEFRCEGQEPELALCPRAPCPGGSCGHTGTVQVVCSELTEVRLRSSGPSPCAGQVEVRVSADWRMLCASHWSPANSHVVCRQVGCGVALPTPKGAHSARGGGGEIWTDRFHCSGAESFLWNCPMSALGVGTCAPGNAAVVVCSGNQTQLLAQCDDALSDPAGSTASEVQAAHCPDSRQLRLVDGGGRCAGRVEILHQGSWGTICDDSWDLHDAHVVCRQLGCGVAFNATASAHFGQGLGPVWLDELNCTGQESHLWKCPSRGWGQHDCRHKEDAGVICSEFMALRMVSEDQECSGWLEIFYNGTWGSVCRTPMEEMTLSVICRQLGCGGSGTLNPAVPARESSRPLWVDGIQCRKTDTSLWQCPSEAWNPRSCQPRDAAFITCTGTRPKSCPDSAPCTDREKLRLRGGDSECSGRVEVWHEGSWGTVCDDSWGLVEAEVVCRQLGCGPALDAPGKAAFGPGNGSIWLDEVRCRAGESSLWACAREPWGQSDCKHEEDAGVRCSGERATVPPLPRSSTSVSAPVPGIFSLPGILCFILGALLLLVLIILGTQLHRWRAELRALSTFEDPLDEAFYEEIDYLVKPQKEDPFDNPGNLSEDSVTKLPYSTEGSEETGDPVSAPEPPAQHADVTENGYDDVEELTDSKLPSPEMTEKDIFLEDGGGARDSQRKIRTLFTVTGISPQSPTEAAYSNLEEEESSLVPRQDLGYDDIELIGI